MFIDDSARARVDFADCLALLKHLRAQKREFEALFMHYAVASPDGHAITPKALLDFLRDEQVILNA